MAPKKSPQKARAASSGGSEGDQTLAALAAGPLRKLPGERPRVLTEEQPLVRQVLPSYEDVDPEFSGDVSALRQSSEVKTIWKDHPIAKHQRSRYCWVAKAVVSRAGEAEEAVFTTDADSMAQTPNWLEAKQNTCDVCGLCCKEVRLS
ncbi:unnamed protein product [Effrenium voratum]|nr:unnamed protein product [Effrenium voratum]